MTAPGPRGGTGLWLGLFGATMGFFEAAVVAYLFRLQAAGALPVLDAPFSDELVLTEVLREAASLLMIVSVAALAARGAVARLAAASVVFGLWDLFYYVFLRMLTGFPGGLLVWDILFLIPVPWVAPVLAPALVSVALVAGGAHALRRERGGAPLRPAVRHWAAAVAGGAVVILSFVIDTPRPFDGAVFPARFRWELFGAGFGLALAGYLACLRRSGGRPG